MAARGEPQRTGPEERRPLVSVAFPVWNEQENLGSLYEEVRDALSQAAVDYEMIFVDNGSVDGSLAIIKELAQRDPAVRYVSLSRNFGHQGGLLAGLDYSRGDAVITMDADLQHPPALIPRMIDLWREGNEVVYTTKKNYRVAGLRSLLVQMFYWLISKLSALRLSFGQSDFRLLDRIVVDQIKTMPESRKFLRGLVEWVGFRQIGIDYEVAERHAGKSKFSFRSLISFAIDGILAFSFAPLRWSLAAGASIALICLAFGLYTVLIGTLNLLGAGYPLPPGWATLTASALFLSSVQLLAIGLLSEYVGRIFEETKQRPAFIVREASRSPHE
jgi:glycosyltransferase involved in cell wall biosynthesis